MIKSDGGFHFEKSDEVLIDIEVVPMGIPEIQNYIEEQFRTKLNLFDEHLFKTKIFVTSENEVVLFFMPHHLKIRGKISPNARSYAIFVQVQSGQNRAIVPLPHL